MSNFLEHIFPVAMGSSKMEFTVLADVRKKAYSSLEDSQMAFYYVSTEMSQKQLH